MSKAIIKKIISTVILIICLVAVAWVTFLISKPDSNEMITYDGVRHIAMPLIMSCLFLFLFVRAQTAHNKDLRQRFNLPLTRKNLIKSVFTSIDYWLDCMGFAIAAFTLKFPDFYEILSNGNGITGRLKALAITLPVFMVLDLLARYIGMGAWFKKAGDPYIQSPSLGKDSMAGNSSKLVPTSGAFSAMRFLSRTYSVNSSFAPELENQEIKDDESAFNSKAKIKSFVWVFILIALAIIFSKFLYSAISLVAWMLIKFALKWQTWAIIGGLVGLILAIRIGKALVSRHKLIKALKKTCSAKKCRISKINNPYKSLFSAYNGENFSVTINGKTYSCKFISSLKPSRPLILRKDGMAMFVHGITFAGVNWFQSTKKFRFDYQSNNPQILIINPSIKFTYCAENGGLSEIDNGDKIGNYLIYTGNSLINAIERDCINRK